MNIWLVNPFDTLPEESLRQGRYGYLSKMLAAKGHMVTWWSSNFVHGTKRFRSQRQTSIQVSENLRIVLLKTPRYNRNVSLRRIWNHCVYARELRTEGRKCQQPPDLIITSSPPLLAANVASALAKRFHAKLVVDVQDLWPEVFEIAFPTKLRGISKILLRPLKMLADRAYAHADGIVAVSQTSLDRALSAAKGKPRPSMVLYLGVDLDAYADYANKQVEDMRWLENKGEEVWVIYCGVIGRAYEIKVILEAAEGLGHSYPGIKFFVAGIGPDYEEMRSYAAKRLLSNTTLTGLLSYHQLVHLLQSCDIGLNPSVTGVESTMPNKLFDYLARGLPVISSRKGELESLIHREHVGLQYEAGDAESLAKAIMVLYNNPQERLAMGQRARKLAEERFDMNKEYPKFEEFVKGCM